MSATSTNTSIPILEFPSDSVVLEAKVDNNNINNGSSSAFSPGEPLNVLFTLSLRSNEHFHQQREIQKYLHLRKDTYSRDASSGGGADSEDKKNEHLIVHPLNPQQQKPQVVLNGDELCRESSRYINSGHTLQDGANTHNNNNSCEDRLLSKNTNNNNSEQSSTNKPLKVEKQRQEAETINKTESSYVRTPSVIVDQMTTRFESILSVDGSRFQIPDELHHHHNQISSDENNSNSSSSQEHSSHSKTSSSSNQKTKLLYSCCASHSNTNNNNISNEYASSSSSSFATPAKPLNVSFSCVLPPRLPPTFVGASCRIRHVLSVYITFHACADHRPGEEIIQEEEELETTENDKLLTKKNKNRHFQKQIIELRLPIPVALFSNSANNIMMKSSYQNQQLANLLSSSSRRNTNNNNPNSNDSSNYYYNPSAAGGHYSRSSSITGCNFSSLMNSKYPVYLSLNEKHLRHDARARLVEISSSSSSSSVLLKNNVRTAQEENNNNIQSSSSFARFCQNTSCTRSALASHLLLSSSPQSGSRNSNNSGALPLEIPIIHSSSSSSSSQKQQQFLLGYLTISSTDIRVNSSSSSSSGNFWRLSFTPNSSSSKSFVVAQIGIVFEKEELVSAKCVRKGASIPQSSIAAVLENENDENNIESYFAVDEKEQEKEDKRWIIVERKKMIEKKLHCLEEALNGNFGDNNNNNNSSTAPPSIDLNFNNASILSPSAVASSSPFFSSATTSPFNPLSTLLLSPSFVCEMIRSTWKLKCTFSIVEAYASAPVASNRPPMNKTGFQVPHLYVQPGEEQQQQQRISEKQQSSSDSSSKNISNNKNMAGSSSSSSQNGNANFIGMYMNKEIPIVEDLEIVVPVNFV